LPATRPGKGRRLVYERSPARETFDGEFLYLPARWNSRSGCTRSVARIGEHEKADTWIWTYEDVTAQRAAEEALRQSHLELEQRVGERTRELSQQLHFMRQLIEAIPGPVFYKIVRRALSRLQSGVSRTDRQTAQRSDRRHCPTTSRRT
jgi:hypothetical protein